MDHNNPRFSNRRRTFLLANDAFLGADRGPIEIMLVCIFNNDGRNIAGFQMSRITQEYRAIDFRRIGL